MMIKGRFRKIIIILIIVIVVGSIAYFSFSKKEKVEYTTAKVERGELIQSVSETGTVKATSEIELNFLNSGKITKILVEIGDKVKKGQVLTEIDYSSFLIKEREAQAKLDKLLRGATSEEIAVKQASVNQTRAAYLAAINELEKVENSVEENVFQAENTLDDLESDSPDSVTAYEQAIEVAQTKLNNIKSTYQQSINNEENDILITIESEITDASTALDTINTVVTDNDAKDVLSIKNTIYLTNTKNTRSEALSLFNEADNSLSIAETNKTEFNIDEAIKDANNLLNKTFESLNFCFDALENSITSSDFTQTELDSFKSNISSELTTISTSISNVQTAEQDLDGARLDYDTNVSNAEEALIKAQVDLDDAIIDARNSLNTARFSGEQQITVAQTKVDNTREAWEVAKVELAKIKAPARNEDIILAQAELDTVKKQIEDSIIKAPIDGTITKINYEISEQSTASKPVISMLAENNYEIEVDISEADIAKVNLNNFTEITLDAFGDEKIFNGKVYFIEPAETVIQDVIYYKVKIEFTNDTNYSQYANNIKSGMTANVVITTVQKKNVLIMPSRAVVQKNGEKYVRVLVNGAMQEVPVKVGLRGDEGMVEVLKGVKEGDEVVTFVKNAK